MKPIIKWTCLFLICLIAAHTSAFAAAKTVVNELVCEYHTNPLGIDVQTLEIKGAVGQTPPVPPRWL